MNEKLDSKTLADVQPGGRVRLGDRPKDGEVLVEVSGLTGSGKSAIAGEIEILCKALGLEVEWVNGDEEKRLTHADWIGALEMYKPKVVIVERNIPRAALSAQPSPGGLGDARALIQRYDAAGAKFRESLMDDHYSDAQRVELRRELTAVQDELLTALSAQPSPGGQEWPFVESPADFSERMVQALRKFDMLGAVRHVLIENPPTLAARQPVGAAVAYIEHFADKVSRMEMTMPGLHLGIGRHPVYAAPPAQAVDLGAVRALLQRRIEQWRSHLPADPGAPGTREIETKGEHDYNNDVRIYREGIAVMEEVLSKIDSQA